MLPEATPGSRAELVRLPADRAARRAVRAATTLIALPRVAQDRHAAALRRQPDPPARLRRVAPTASSATSPTTDLVMRDAFWIGVYPGLTDADARLRHRLAPVMVPALSGSRGARGRSRARARPHRAALARPARRATPDHRRHRLRRLLAARGAALGQRRPRGRCATRRS